MIKGIRKTEVQGCLVIDYERFVDDRGTFQEMSNVWDFSLWYPEFSLPESFDQSNVTHSTPMVLRGLHLQKVRPQGKLIQCHMGSIYDVCVDLRAESKSFMKWHMQRLSFFRASALYVPPGCAHGFYSPEESIVSYLCTETYDKHSDGGILWNDPELNIPWPIEEKLEVIISPKDAKLPTAREYLKALG